MITLRCGNCGRGFRAKEEHAGKRLKCPNCEAPITVPAPPTGAATNAAEPQQRFREPQATPQATPQPQAAGQPQATMQPQAAGGQTIVVQVGQQGGSNMVGPAQKSQLVVWLLQALCPGTQYFYLEQTGKGILFTLLSLFVWAPLVFFTCGFGLIPYVPYAIFLLVDSLMIASHMKKEAISQWKFF